ncbi:hypothetical protein D3C78_1976160 [compost metagenome]
MLITFTFGISLVTVSSATEEAVGTPGVIAEAPVENDSNNVEDNRTPDTVLKSFISRIYLSSYGFLILFTS